MRIKAGRGFPGYCKRGAHSGRGFQGGASGASWERTRGGARIRGAARGKPGRGVIPGASWGAALRADPVRGALRAGALGRYCEPGRAGALAWAPGPLSYELGSLNTGQGFRGEYRFQGAGRIRPQENCRASCNSRSGPERTILGAINPGEYAPLALLTFPVLTFPHALNCERIFRRVKKWVYSIFLS